MKLIREESYGFSSRYCSLGTKYYSVTRIELDALAKRNSANIESISIPPVYHNYDGFVEIAASGIKGQGIFVRAKNACDCNRYYIEIIP